MHKDQELLINVRINCGDLQKFTQAVRKFQMSGLWRVPLKLTIKNEKYDTILLNRPYPVKPINSFYEIPITEQVIRHLHTCAGSTTKETWLKAIGLDNYTTWPGLTIKAANKYYPKLEETIKGHIQHTRQGVRPTK